VFVELGLAEQRRVQSAAEAGDLSGRRECPRLLLTEGCHLSEVELGRLRPSRYDNCRAPGAGATAAMTAIPTEFFAKMVK